MCGCVVVISRMFRFLVVFLICWFRVCCECVYLFFDWCVFVCASVIYVVLLAPVIFIHMFWGEGGGCVCVSFVSLSFVFSCFVLFVVRVCLCFLCVLLVVCVFFVDVFVCVFGCVCSVFFALSVRHVLCVRFVCVCVFSLRVFFVCLGLFVCELCSVFFLFLGFDVGDCLFLCVCV